MSRAPALAAAALLAACWPLPVRALEVSSSTVRDIHQLVGPVLSASSATARLTAFPERLYFQVSWGIFSVGTATLEVEDVVDFDGRPAYHVVDRAVSNDWCDTFYKVRDLNESWIDAATRGSLGYAKRLREGRYYRDEWAFFDRSLGKFLARTNGRDGNFAYQSGKIPPNVQDILSSLYYVRSQDLQPGKDVELDVNTRKNWPLVIHVVKKERIKTPAGRFDTILVEPALREEGLFIQKGRKLQVWLTDDAKKTPVQMKVEVFFGHITAKLAKVI